jgi:hypothetical protein
VLTAVPLNGQSSSKDNITEPLRCWWRTSAGAVAVGEPFEATITCAARESDPIRVVPDESRLQSTAIQLAPFEVLGGSHPADLRTSTHRFFQYHYTVRIISPDVIGRDAKFPDIQVHYRVHDRIAGDTVEGRDRAYLLPGQSVRVLSLVPVEADDIRDSSNLDFSTITSLRFRARGFRLAAVLFGILGFLVLASVLLRAVGQRVRTSQPSITPVPARSALGHVLAELKEVQRQSRAGWTMDLVARAASAGRIAAATGLGRRLAQHQHAPGRLPPAGSLVCTRGWLRRHDFVVSSSITSGELDQRLQQLPVRLAGRKETLEQLHRSLSTQTRVLYAATSEIDSSAHDAAVDEAISATHTLLRAHAWRREWFGSRVVGQTEAEA